MGLGCETGCSQKLFKLRAIASPPSCSTSHRSHLSQAAHPAPAEAVAQLGCKGAYRGPKLHAVMQALGDELVLKGEVRIGWELDAWVRQSCESVRPEAGMGVAALRCL